MYPTGQKHTKRLAAATIILQKMNQCWAALNW